METRLPLETGLRRGQAFEGDDRLRPWRGRSLESPVLLQQARCREEEEEEAREAAAMAALQSAGAG